MNQKQKTYIIGALILTAVWLVAVLFKSTPQPMTQIETPVSGKEQAAAEESALRELLPEAEKIVPGDVKSLKKLYQQKLGLEISEIRKNPDGTYDAVISGGKEIHLKQAAALTPTEQKEYREEFMSVFNEGKEVEITEQDKKEIEAFRRGVLGK